MQKEMITSRQAICILVVYIFGSSVVMGVSTEASQDSWISLLLGALFAVPVFAAYARIMKLFPEKDFFEITGILFGKIGGKILNILMIWYAIHLAALVLRNFTEFIQVVAMPETPQLPVMIAMVLLTVYIAKSGVEILGKWSLIAAFLVIFVIALTIVLSLSKMNYSNLLPIMDHSVGTIVSGSYQLLTFPYAESVIFLGIGCAVKKKNSPYKIYLYALLISSVVLLFVILRNLGLLGALGSAEYFPSYAAARLINIGDFLTRIEGSISMNFILAGVTKITLCVIVAAKGVASVFGIKDYRGMVMPVGLLSVALCAVLYNNTMEMFSFIKVYQYYAIPFEFAIPLTVWIAAEIKMRKAKLNVQQA